MANKPELKTPADVAAFFQAWGAQHQIAMNGIIEQLPEALRGEWQGLKDGLNAILVKLTPIDQVPAAQEAGYALNSFANTVSSLLGYTDMLRERLALLGADFQKKVVALNGFDTQIASGDLLPKDKYTSLIDQARTDATAETMKLVSGMRVSAIALAGLPAADAATLALGVAEFDAAFTLAKANVATLAGKGMTLAGKGSAWVKDLAWSSATAFQGQMTKIDDLVTAPKAVPAAGDPLLGAGNKPADATPAAETAPRKLTLA